MVDTHLPAPEPAAERSLFTSRTEYAQAADRLLEAAQSELRIFDPDLADYRLEAPARIESLRRFLMRNNFNRLWIVVHDADAVQRHCPRLVALLGTFSGRFWVNRTLDDAAKAEDCFVLADRLHVVRRPVARQGRGVLLLNDPRESQMMRERFEQIWANSEPGVSPNTTGL